jgi:aromatic-L-amino-acid decarboxylase
MITSRQDNPLELSTETLRDLTHSALEYILAHIESLPTQPSTNTGGGRKFARSLVEPIPQEGTPFEDLLKFLFKRAVPCSFNTAGPGYLAYIPGGGLPHAAVADLISNTVNPYVGLWLAAPALVQLEANVVRWFCDMVGFPAAAGGTLTSGGSLANLTALITARRERLPENFLGGTLYVSDQVHHSVTKAALLAGFPARNVRLIPTDSRLRLRLDTLEEQIRKDRDDGLTPFFLVANAGSTNTGAVDDLNGLADLAKSEGLWFHVDAAYGGFFMLTERGAIALDRIGRADSVTLDPHKGLFLPYGTGSLLVRDIATLRRTHSTEADYMPPMQDEGDLVDFCEISPELSRDFRGLRVWLPLKMHGIGVFRDNLDEKLDLARAAAAELATIRHLEILAEPLLSLVVFRLAPPHLPEEELNKLNRRFLKQINKPRRVILTSTMIPGNRYVLRICVLSFRTHQDRMEMAYEDIRQAADKVLR